MCFWCMALASVCRAVSMWLPSCPVQRESKMKRCGASRCWGKWKCMGLLWMLVQVQWSCVTSQSCLGNISLSEYDALQSLYNSTNGADWFWHAYITVDSIWHFTGDLSAPCTVPWQGLVCAPVPASQSCSIEQLNLGATNANRICCLWTSR